MWSAPWAHSSNTQSSTFFHCANGVKKTGGISEASWPISNITGIIIEPLTPCLCAPSHHKGEDEHHIKSLSYESNLNRPEVTIWASHLTPPRGGQLGNAINSCPQECCWTFRNKYRHIGALCSQLSNSLRSSPLRNMILIPIPEWTLMVFLSWFLPKTADHNSIPCEQCNIT